MKNGYLRMAYFSKLGNFINNHQDLELVLSKENFSQPFRKNSNLLIGNKQKNFIWARRFLLKSDEISTYIICSIYTNNLHSHFIHIRIRCRLDVWMFLSTSHYIIIPSKQRLCNILSFSVTCRIKDQRRDIISLQIQNQNFPFVILTAQYGLKL